MWNICVNVHIYFFYSYIRFSKTSQQILRWEGSVQNHVKPRFSIRYSFLDLSLISWFVTHFLDTTLQQILRWDHLKTWWEHSTEFLGGRVYNVTVAEYMKTIHSNKKVYLQNQDTTLRIQPKVSTKSHVIKHTLRIQPKVSTKSHVIKLTLRIQSKVST